MRVYERLKENCILELDGFPFPMMDFPWPGDSSSGRVSSFHMTSSGNLTHLDLEFSEANKASG